MASIYPFYEEAEHTETILVASYKGQNEVQMKVNWAATQIQSFFRGMMARKLLNVDRKAAIIIQKYVRGFLLRYHLPDMLQEYYDGLCLKVYNKAAAKVQALWKGYVFRKFEFNIKDVLEQRAQVAKANEEIFQLFKQPFNEFNKTEYEISDEYLHKIYKVLFDRHHFLSTERKRGILSKSGTEELSVLEKLIKTIPWKDYINKIHDIYYDCSSKNRPIKYKYSDKRLQSKEDYLRYIIERSMELPLPSKKEKKYDFHLTARIDRTKPDAITTRGKFIPPITDITRTLDSSKNVCCKDFDLIIPHKDRLRLKPKKPNYNPNYWFEECPCRQREYLQFS